MKNALVSFSAIEHAIALADTPAKVRTLDAKLAAIQELFRHERRALADQNKLATLRIRTQRQGGALLAGKVRRGRPSKKSHDATFTLPEGIDKHMSERWQALAAISEEELSDYLDEQLASDGEVTVAGLTRFVEGDAGKVHYSSATAEWLTPKDIIDRVVMVLGEIDLDPCSNSKSKPNVPAKELFTKKDDGLDQAWAGSVYMNPPYGKDLPMWTRHLLSEFASGSVTEAIALVPARTDTEWYREMGEFVRCFLFGRLKFSDSENSAPFPSMVVYLGDSLDKFVAAFADIGDCYQRMAR